jgi:hypothetical protein
MINLEVTKNGTENNVSLIRRFTKKVQSSGVLPRVRGIRYATRKQSKYVKKKTALKLLTKRTEREQMIRLGKLKETSKK